MRAVGRWKKKRCTSTLLDLNRYLTILEPQIPSNEKILYFSEMPMDVFYALKIVKCSVGQLVLLLKLYFMTPVISGSVYRSGTRCVLL